MPHSPDEARATDQPGTRPDRSFAEAPENQGPAIGPHDPSTMPRAEDDAHIGTLNPDTHAQEADGRRR